MDELDFTPAPKKAPAPGPAPVKPVAPAYNPGLALEFFREGGRPEEAPAGSTIFAEAERANRLFLKRDKMYLLVEGEVALSAKGRPIGSVKIGEMFGEMSAISDLPRSATAVAKTACRLIAIDDKGFLPALQKKPDFALMLMGVMTARLRSMLGALKAGGGPSADVKESRIFDKGLLSELARGLGEQAAVRYQRGQVIFQEGHSGVMMYVVYEGRVTVSIGTNVVQLVGPGGVLGEMALVDQAARAATAVAEADSTLLAINRTVFLSLMKVTPQFGAALLAAVAERVHFVAASR